MIEEAFSYRDKSGTNRWAAKCRCDCGAVVTVMVQNLKGRTESCGCTKRKGTMSASFAQSRGRPRLTAIEAGKRFGNLVAAEEFHERNAAGRLLWKVRCTCDCGESVIVLASNLKNGTTRSCGCLQRKRASEGARSRATHAMSNHEHYPRWHNMMHRCYNPQDKHYKNWGGRGIRVCQEWMDVRVFVSYLESALGPRPDGHSLDRIDNDGNYEPGNVRWATTLTQRHNQRRGAGWGPRSYWRRRTSGK